ncbi:MULTISPECIES: PTS glucitol/sorbitol transporter subunit IIA [Parageobacillus]|jgi:glucitol/sorbitol PTS system EIIA component|uniref:PTS sorbitol transporter subunit IIA n=1 Tax=Parageobacillus thermoglucosidasius TaxID=1426 RepID=A0A1B7KSS0_PARTM|nr:MULTISPECIES: PTS glucitol/sorbitol transporter subunit IIA [Parageobacillus]OAT73113.1 PTS sorbitol transporter subunit IIA [Parageobacillus thermoglucosidasius]BDG46047.1 PTS sorbitol transporter subunit IIA [Parageobacillus sp. KH3-4]
MRTIYENTIKSVGPMAEEFLSEKMLILFGDRAPDELKNYCFVIDVVEVTEEIQTGDVLYMDNEKFVITSVGDVVCQNLGRLGHITLKFDGSTTPQLPGTLHLEQKELPKIGVGTKLKIMKE